MQHPALEDALVRLGESFARRDWKYLDVPAGSPTETSYAWPGAPDENIMICVHKGPDIEEDFHRQDFFFFNFAYKGNYGALSQKDDNRILVRENECYIGQPYTGYALSAHSREEIIIIGVLIQKETFFRTFLPVLSVDSTLFHFFLDPQADMFSQEFIHLHFDEPVCIRTLLELMVIEYAHPQEETQSILQPMVLTLLMQVARRYKALHPASGSERLADAIVSYLGAHLETASLKETARHFARHPNYISTLLRHKLGKSFSELVREQRMDRARALLQGTGLPVEEIALMLGYSNPSNFYKAFRQYYGTSPREYVRNAP